MENIFFEIGLNHLGSKKEAIFLIENLLKKKLKLNISIQIREESFYSQFPEYELEIEEYFDIIEYCNENEISFGLSLGPIKDINRYQDVISRCDFIKLLSISVINNEFIKKIQKVFKKTIFLSLGLVNFNNELVEYSDLLKQKNIIPLYTSLTHNIQGQNLDNINLIKKYNKTFAYGHHCSHELIFYIAIGFGAKYIFLYVGDKSKKLPDHEHAFDINNLDVIISKISNCFLAKRVYTQKSMINFLG
ncbi:MAG: N-acetylneuraminate synthase family protein [Methylophilaceae bacterium]